MMATGPDGRDFFFEDAGVAETDAARLQRDFAGAGCCKSEISDEE
jgi:hypothetical protein